MDKQYLSKVINYARDIEPYGFIQIHAGVGSGKNTFIEKLIEGYTWKDENGIECSTSPKTVLLITSRRAKVNEILSDDKKEDEDKKKEKSEKDKKEPTIGAYVLEWENGAPADNIDEYCNSTKQLADIDGFGRPKIHQRSIACTNAAIEKYLQNHYNPLDISTHLWQRFDFIVLDEAHSVLADASYQSAPYYVHELINQAYREYKNGTSTCKVIIMTGSPKILSNFKIPKKGNHLDVLDSCHSVVPKALSFVDGVEAKKSFKRRLAGGERVIYFANHINTIFGLYSDLNTEQQAATAFSFSKAERLNINDPAQRELYDRMKNTEEVIAEKQRLPEDITLLLTTSKNKEGINIKNKDIKAMYVEAHTEVDIIQMAGRVREGIDVLYVVTDSGGFGKTESAWEYKFSSCEVLIDAFDVEPGQGQKELNLVEFSNDFFYKLLRESGIDLRDPWGRKPIYTYEKAKEFIDFVHSKFPYIRYNYFTDEFALYHDRKCSLDYYQEQNALYDAAANDQERLTALAQSWYEGISVIWPETLQDQIDRYLTDNGLMEIPYGDERRKKITSDLSLILGREVKQLRYILRQYGYDEKDCSKNLKASTYGMKKIVKR